MSTDQQNQADTATARHAERVVPNITTSETIAAMYSATPAPTEAPTQAPKGEPKGENQPGNDGGKEGKKNRFQERIGELVEKRRAAETEAEHARRENDELRSRLAAMTARAEPVKDEPRPARDKFANDDEYIDAVSDWKANQAIAKREREQAEAQAKAQNAQLASAWQKAQERARADIDDYDDVVGKSDVQLPGHLHQAIFENEDVGPYLAYYFAKHPEEAKRFAAMSPTTALRQLGKLEDRLMDDSEQDPNPKPTPAPEKSKAPPPITPVKDGRSAAPGPANSFDEYRARRKAEQKG
jgi:hypothetical protein